MELAVQCVVYCLLFTLMILPAQYRNPLNLIASYPPEIIKRVEELPQYRQYIHKTRKKHISKKLTGVAVISVILAFTAYFSDKRDFLSAFIHVFIIFSVVNIYDLLILDWGVFCHSKKLRILGTEDMDKEYKDYLFHLKGAAKGELIAVIISLLAGGLVSLAVILF